MNVENLKVKAAQGVYWNFIQLIINKLFGLVIKLVLAKLLFPEQFGLIGMASVCISFVGILNDIGIGSALIQRKNEQLRQEHFHTAFWTGLIWSCGLYLVMVFVAAPLAAVFYNEPILEQIIPVISIGIVSGPINLVHKAQLIRQLNFKKLAFIDNSSNIFSGILALILAYSGAGIWALVFNSLASFIIAMPLYFYATRWLPKFIWEKQAFNEMLGFGIYTTGSQILNMLMLNIDYLLIGKLVSASALGKYTLAFVLTDTFRNQITVMINKVMFPIYSQKQSDHKAIKKIYFKVVQYNSICIYPIMIFLIVLAEPFILNFFGEKWEGTVAPLKILAVSVMIHGLVNSHAILIRGLGKPGLEMKVQLIKAISYIPTISMGIYLYGIIGAAWAYVFNKILEVFIAQYFLKKLLNITILDLLAAMKVTLVASIVAFVLTEMLYQFGVHFYICAIALGLSYGSIVWVSLKAEIISYFMSIKNSRKKKVVAA